MSERDRRLQQREAERRSRLIAAGKQTINGPAAHTFEDRRVVLQDRRHQQECYDTALAEQERRAQQQQHERQTRPREALPLEARDEHVGVQAGLRRYHTEKSLRDEVYEEKRRRYLAQQRHQSQPRNSRPVPGPPLPETLSMTNRSFSAGAAPVASPHRASAASTAVAAITPASAAWGPTMVGSQVGADVTRGQQQQLPVRPVAAPSPLRAHIGQTSAVAAGPHVSPNRTLLQGSEPQTFARRLIKVSAGPLSKEAYRRELEEQMRQRHAQRHRENIVERLALPTQPGVPPEPRRSETHDAPRVQVLPAAGSSRVLSKEQYRQALEQQVRDHQQGRRRSRESPSMASLQVGGNGGHPRGMSKEEYRLALESQISQKRTNRWTPDGDHKGLFQSDDRSAKANVFLSKDELRAALERQIREKKSRERREIERDRAPTDMLLDGSSATPSPRRPYLPAAFKALPAPTHPQAPSVPAEDSARSYHPQIQDAWQSPKSSSEHGALRSGSDPGWSEADDTKLRKATYAQQLREQMEEDRQRRGREEKQRMAEEMAMVMPDVPPRGAQAQRPQQGPTGHGPVAGPAQPFGSVAPWGTTDGYPSQALGTTRGWQHHSQQQQPMAPPQQVWDAQQPPQHFLDASPPRRAASTDAMYAAAQEAPSAQRELSQHQQQQASSWKPQQSSQQPPSYLLSTSPSRRVGSDHATHWGASAHEDSLALPQPQQEPPLPQPWEPQQPTQYPPTYLSATSPPRQGGPIEGRHPAGPEHPFAPQQQQPPFPPYPPPAEHSVWRQPPPAQFTAGGSLPVASTTYRAQAGPPYGSSSAQYAHESFGSTQHGSSQSYGALPPPEAPYQPSPMGIGGPLPMWDTALPPGGFHTSKAPRGQGLKEIKGILSDDPSEAERRRKQLEHAQLLARQLEENARRKAAEKADLEVLERREVERIERERKQLEELYTAEEKRKQQEEDTKAMLSNQIEEKKRIQEEGRRKLAEEERLEQVRLVKEREQLQRMYQEERGRESNIFRSEAVQAVGTGNQTDSEPLPEPSCTLERAVPQGVNNLSQKGSGSSSADAWALQQALPHAGRHDSVAGTDPARSQRESTSDGASPEGRRQADVRRRLWGNAGEDKTEAPLSEPQAPSESAAFRLRDSVGGTAKEGNPEHKRRMQELEQELRRHQDVIESLREETTKARDDAYRARTEQLQIQSEISRLKAQITMTQDRSLPNILDAPLEVEHLWEIPGPEMNDDAADKQAANVCPDPPESLNYLMRAASSIRDALKATENVCASPLGTILDQTYGQLQSSDIVIPVEDASSVRLDHDFNNSTFQEDMRQRLDDDHYSGLEHSAESLQAESQFLIPKRLPSTRESVHISMRPSEESCCSPCSFDTMEGSPYDASSDLEAVMRKARERARRLDLPEQDVATGRGLGACTERESHLDSDRRPEYLHGTVRWARRQGGTHAYGCI